MIYFCADDYGLCKDVSAHIQQCIDRGVLNKVSVFPNFEGFDLQKISGDKNVLISLHLNLVEGKCMADTEEVSLIADKEGNFKHQFGGLFKLNFTHGKKFETQVYREIKAQIRFWKGKLPEGMPFSVDSHQHTHMIPAVFRALLKVLKEEKINLKYLRIPAEPLMPFIKKPSLYFTYGAVNIIKQWLLNFLWMFNKKSAEEVKIPAAYFFGILFSGRMDEKRVSKILPEYIRLSKKHGRDVEVLFHPGYVKECDFENKNVVFNKFYLSKNRKAEFDSVTNIAERSVCNGIY